MGDPAPLTTRFWGNVMFVPGSDQVQQFPLHNYATTIPFSYVAPTLADYQLLTPYWTDTTDGKISGINWTTLQTATGYLVTPSKTPPLGTALKLPVASPVSSSKTTLSTH